ncbi:MAG: glycosyltransferase involved in cell wall biosynthesis [Vicingaceae bacterium]|jgi:glycosyltransferase involved in cell wall biosynthesis
MKENLPLVSVIMPAYNAERFIKKSIESIVNQTYKKWELIVIDDGSTDGTATIVQSFIERDDRIKLVVNETNKGLIITRNRGLEESKGKYIANLDSDDIAFKTRLKKQVHFLEEHSDYVLIGSSCENIDSDGNKVKTVRLKLPHHHIAILLLFSNYFINSTTMVKADVAKEIGYAHDIPLAEDYCFFAKISKMGCAGNLKETLVQYRTHESNISKLKAIELNAAIKKIHQKQLERLGILPTESELMLHGSLVVGSAFDLNIKLITVEKWLLRLVAINQKKRLYDEELFNYYCAFFYRRSCEKAKLGVRALHIFRKSEISKYVKNDTKGNSTFFVKSILKGF